MAQPRLEVWVSALALALFVAGRCLVPMDETDLFYNLRLGEIILTTHSVPRTNLFSFVAGEAPDPNLAWLFQILLALVHRAAGIPGTVVLKTAFVVTTFLVLHRVAVRRGAHPALAAAVLALAAWTAEPRFVERPHLVTFLGLALLLLALERAEAGRPRLLWSLVPLGLVWANGNSCFFLAPAILLLYAAGAVLDQRRADARRAALVAVALLPLLFATPAGAGWMGYVANHFRMPSLRPLQEYRVAEWPTDAPFLFMLIAVTLVTVFGPIARVTRHLLPVLPLALLGSRRIRFVAEFALLAGPLVAAQAAPLLAAARARMDIRRRQQPDNSRAGRVPSAAITTAAALLALVVLPRAQAARRGDPVLDLGIEKDLVPTEAIAWVDAHGLRDRMYNDLEVGSYLIWQGWPRHQVFQDPRINGYPAWLHAILRRQDLGQDEWEDLLDRQGVTSALITFPDVNPRAALFDPERWALVRRGDDGLVFARRVPRWRALIGAEEIPLTFAFNPTSGVRPIVLDRQPPQSPLPACEWNRRRGAQLAAAGEVGPALAALTAALTGAMTGAMTGDPTSDDDCLTPSALADAREQAASLALLAGSPARALDLLAGLPSARARTDRGLALLQLNRHEEALAELEQATRLAPGDAAAAFGRALALSRLHRRVPARQALRDFLARWPDHVGGPTARGLLRELGDSPDDAPPPSFP